MNSTPSQNYRSLWGPAWRCALAQTLRPRFASEFSDAGDPWVRDFAGYLAIQARGAEGAAQEKFPVIADAIVLQDNAELTAKLKVMVLADMNLEEMHQRLEVSATALQAWEAIFFDVRDLREATSWLAAAVIEPEQKTGNTALATYMKLAISGGVVAVRTLLDCDAKIPLDEADRVFQRKLKLDVKLNEVLDLPLDSEQARLRFIAIYTETQLATKRLELVGRRLEERCVQARERHELAKLRIELAKQREERRAVERQQASENRQQRQSAKQQRQAPSEDLRKYQQRAEQMVLEARIAASPLAQLTWSSGADANPVGSAAGSLATSPPQEVVEPLVPWTDEVWPAGQPVTAMPENGSIAEFGFVLTV